MLVGVVVCLMVMTVAVWGQQLRIGGALNIFGRYGYLTISMKVVPRNDTDTNWKFREPVVDVFKDLVATRSVPGMEDVKAVFHGDFHMEFCEDVPQLLQAYFREYTVERLDRPWQAFTGGWSQGAIARNLGLNSSHIVGDRGYVLVRVARHRESARLGFTPSHASLHEAVALQAAALTLGDLPALGQFIRSFGSHYISSYITGNSLYQVLVYPKIVYRKLKDKLQESGISSIGNSELTSLFSPFYAEHIGSVLCASGNATLMEWANTALRLSTYFYNYTSLLKLHGNTKLLKELDTLLGNEALLQLHLKTLAPVFKDIEKRRWFEEVIDNNLKLWEVNM